MPNSGEMLYSFTAEQIDGTRVALAEFRGQVLLIVNTASQCGFTPQYQGLEALYRAYHDRGFSVLAFPCNQFGSQEPGGTIEIAEFCDRNYRISFPIFAKIEVNGPGTHPLYGYLKGQQRGRFGLLTGGRIPWNFTKFLCGRSGAVEARFGPARAPEKLAPYIENLLDR